MDYKTVEAFDEPRYLATSQSSYRPFRNYGINFGALEQELSDSDFEKPSGWGARHTLVLLGFWGYVISYAMRINLSFAIVAMVITNTTESKNKSVQVTAAACPDLIEDLPEKFPINNQAEFHWDGEDQGIILGAFSFGYAISQLPGGMLTDRFGGKWPFGIGILITAIFALLTPAGARAGKQELFKIRVIQGLAEGIIGPSMHGLLAIWMPPMETSKLGAFVYTGTRIGIVLTLPLCGILISSGVGWDWIFYLTGILGIIWFIFWAIFVFDDPMTHPNITPEELFYIQQTIGIRPSKQQIPTPWRQMITSLPVTAIVVAQTGQGWGLQTLLTELPTYMKSVLMFDESASGFLSALPYIAMWIISLIACWYADEFRENHLGSTTLVRKVCNTIAHWIPAIALIGIAFSGCNRVLTILLLIIAVGFNGFAAAGYQMNHIDISPNHSAVMSGYTNTIANFCGMAAPYLTGVITNDGGTIAEWRLVFIISAAIYIFANLFYICFASGEEQNWNRDPNAENYDYMREMDEYFPLLTDNYDEYSNWKLDQNAQYVFG